MASQFKKISPISLIVAIKGHMIFCLHTHWSTDSTTKLLRGWGEGRSSCSVFSFSCGCRPINHVSTHCTKLHWWGINAQTCGYADDDILHIYLKIFFERPYSMIMCVMIILLFILILIVLIARANTILMPSYSEVNQSRLHHDESACSPYCNFSFSQSV